MALTNKERAVRFYARRKAQAALAALTVCPHCGGSLAGAASAAAGAPIGEAAPEPDPPPPQPQPPRRPQYHPTAPRDLTDADIAALPLGTHRVAKCLQITIGTLLKSFRFLHHSKTSSRRNVLIGYWPDMSVAQAVVKTAELWTGASAAADAAPIATPTEADIAALEAARQEQRQRASAPGLTDADIAVLEAARQPRVSEPYIASCDLTDADIAALTVGTHRVANCLTIAINIRYKTFTFSRFKRHARIGYWPDMSVAQAVAKAAELWNASLDTPRTY